MKIKERLSSYGFPLLFMALLVFVKYVYFHTAESAVDIEELPLVPLNAVANGAGVVDIGDTRLYGVTYITNYVFLKIFGFNIGALKLTSLAFFFVACFALFQISKNWFQGQSWLLRYLPVSMFAFGPPVAQMWALKNRGGFIETIAAFALLVWLYQRWYQRKAQTDHVYAMGALSGLAIWAQPISIVFVIPVFSGILWEGFRGKFRLGLLSTVRFGLAGILGLMPLVALNFLYNFNTVRVLAGGEGGQGADTPVARLVRLVWEGMPRIFGLKQQWSNDWVVGEWLSIAILLIFMLAIVSVAALVAVRFVSSRRFDEKVVLVGAAFLLFLGNIFASWGSFQEEPRRLLLIYVPFVLLVVLAMARNRLLLVTLALLWFGVSTYSNVAYVRSNINGFQNPFYQSFDGVADFLLKHDINHVYVNIWEGPKISFGSRMRITWSNTPYLPSGKGFLADGGFSFHDAAAFYKLQPGALDALERMRQDLAATGIDCVESEVDNFVVIYACSSEFNLFRLAKKADQIREFQKNQVVFDWARYSSGAYGDLYAREASLVWTRPLATIPVRTSFHAGQYICITTGPERQVRPEDLHLIFGTSLIPMQHHPASQNETRYVSPAIVGDGGHQLTISVPPFVPAKSGSGDSRSLGLPLRTIRFVNSTAECK